MVLASIAAEVTDAGTRRTRSARPSFQVVVATAFAWAVALGVFLLVALIAPDDGLTSNSFRQGIGYAAMFAAPPVGAFLNPLHARAFGGALIIAGAATTPGGNSVGLLMVVSGIALFLAGSRDRVSLGGTLLRLLVTAAALVAGIYLGLGAGWRGTLAAIVISVAIAISGLRG